MVETDVGVTHLFISLEDFLQAGGNRDGEILDCQAGTTFAGAEWIFVGSSFGSNGFCEAAYEGTLVDINSTYQATSSIISPSTECGAGTGSYRTKSGSVPPAGTLVTVHLSKKTK